MSQLPLFFGLQLLGSWACVAVGPRNEWLGLAIGFVVGLALAVFLSLPLLLLGVFTAASVIAVLVLALAGAVGLAIRRGRATRATAIRSVVWALAFTAACVPFCAWDVSVQTYDSTVFIDYAVALQDLQQLTLDTLSYLHSWGSFQIIAHALAVVTRENHLYALAPAFSISLFATVAVALHRGLDGLPTRWRVAAAAIVVGGMLAVPLVRLHVVYVHANWAAAGYLFVFGALFWLAEITTDAGYLPPAFLALLAFSFARVESSMFTALFLLLALSQTRLPRRVVLVPYLAFTLVLTAWLLLLGAVAPEDSIYLTPQRSLIMAAAIAGMGIAFALRDSRLLRPLLPRVPVLAAIVTLAVVAVAIATHLDNARISLAIWQHDLWLGAFWGYFLWPLFAVLAVVSVWLPMPPSSRALRYSIGLFFGLMVLLTALGSEYGSGRYGSLTRVTLHIVPLVWFYFGLTFAPVFYRRMLGSRT